MSLQAPPTLLELASQSLVRNEALDPSSLQDLPMDFFLPIFLEAFKGGQTHVLKSMVQAWPFPSLPLGSLMKTPHLETLQAILDGLAMLLAMKDRPREWKLHVLSLQNGDENIWKMGCGRIARACSELPGCLLQWVKMRKQVVQLCCRRLQILSDSTYKIEKFLRVVCLDSIEELEVDSFFHQDTMKVFVPYLGRMRSLRKFSFHESDLKHLSECPSTGQLKHLNLSNIDMRNFSPQPLRALLEKVAGTLETLVLDLCGINDSHVDHILPGLDCCSHLTMLSCYGNHMSMSGLSNLMCHTKELSQLSHVLYPVPLIFEEEYYVDFSTLRQ
ncbi:PRAME family member 14-like, partial [Nannospalax galili]|uniref:PRAME family member 14-like n=1 Tax=Nannospalax galili TaxID=1026970 RepID=UPI00111C19AA